MKTLLTISNIIFIISFSIFLWRLLFKRHLPKKNWFIISFISLLIFGYFDDKYNETNPKEKIISLSTKPLEEQLLENKENWISQEEAEEELVYAKNILQENKDSIFNKIKNISTYKNNLISFFKNEIPYNQIYLKDGLIYSLSTNKPVNGVVTLRGGDGNVYYRQDIKDGQKHGVYQEFYPNHNLKAEGFYLNGIKNKRWKTYFDNENNQLETSYAYLNGKYNDSMIIYYENGEVEKRGKYLDGFKVGEWEGFFPDGTIEFEAKYKNDKPEGKWKLYHSNGNIKAIGKFSKGEKIEIWKYYYSNGELREEIRHTFLGIQLQ